MTVYPMFTMSSYLAIRYIRLVDTIYCPDTYTFAEINCR